MISIIFVFCFNPFRILNLDINLYYLIIKKEMKGFFTMAKSLMNFSSAKS